MTGRWQPRPALCAVALAAVAVAGCDSPTGPSGPPPPQANAAPVIQGVLASVTSRTEVDTDVAVAVAVTDADTPVDGLTYDWRATAGVITGSGRNVTWRLPKGSAATPQDITISVTITEPYQTLENGVLINRQHRVEGSAAPFRVHDSPAEVRNVSVEFLENFADNTATPEFCVKDFSDAITCGKATERDEIALVRRSRFITDSKLTVRSAILNGALTRADVEIDCRFESTVIQKINAMDFSPGENVVAEGLCILQVIYDAGRWRLCFSLFEGGEVRAAAVEAIRPRRSVAAALLGYRR